MMSVISGHDEYQEKQLRSIHHYPCFHKCLTHLDERRESGGFWSNTRLVFGKKGIMIKKILDVMEDRSQQYFPNNGKDQNCAKIFAFLSFTRFIN